MIGSKVNGSVGYTPNSYPIYLVLVGEITQWSDHFRAPGHPPSSRSVPQIRSTVPPRLCRSGGTEVKVHTCVLKTCGCEKKRTGQFYSPYDRVSGWVRDRFTIVVSKLVVYFTYLGDVSFTYKNIGVKDGERSSIYIQYHGPGAPKSKGSFIVFQGSISFREGNMTDILLG